MSGRMGAGQCEDLLIYITRLASAKLKFKWVHVQIWLYNLIQLYTVL
jgi:hypothetical protein